MLQQTCIFVIMTMTGVFATRPSDKVITLKTHCSRDSFNLKFDMGRPFKGIVFAKEFVEDCKATGNYSDTIELNMPTFGCGIRSEPKENGSMELAVKIVVQMDGKLRQSSDVQQIAKCTVPPDMMSMNLDMRSSTEKSSRNGRMKSGTVQPKTHPVISRIRVWLELGGENNSGSVEVGQATTLGIKAVLPGTIGVRVVDCSALDGLGESSQKLIDEKGCAIDEQVMPALLKRVRPVEIGWSRPQKDDLVEKLFQTTFPAFKFPDRERLHVTCGVQLCKEDCPKIDCNMPGIGYIDSEKLITRIEVFNSMTVTAPQIDLQGYNVTVDEYKYVQKPKSDGTLCLSTSKLAMSFCILGLVFLIAVIVALCCMWKSRTKNRDINYHRTTGTSIFSSSSSSQSRFGSKLLIPYGGGSLPYGRVY